MLVARLTKTYPANYMSHLDFIRAVTRTIERAKISVKYSVGFNPHMEIYLTPPSPLGLQSFSEYATVYTDITPQEFMERFNAVSVSGIKVSDCYEVNSDSKLAAKIKTATYEVKIKNPEKITEIIKKVLSSDKYLIQWKTREGLRNCEVRGKIISMDVCGDVLKLTLSAGNNNLRADRLLNFMLDEDINIADIYKTESDFN